MLGNGRTKQDGANLSLKVIFNPQKDEFYFFNQLMICISIKVLKCFYNTKKISKISECFGTSTGIYKDYSDFTQSVLTENGAC